MAELIEGLVVDFGRANTRNLSTKDYMREMGADPDGIGYTPLELDNSVDPNSSEFNYYIDSVKRLNQFGLAAAQKGINVYQPNPNNPEAGMLAQRFNDMKTELTGEAIALRSSAQMRQLQVKEGNKANVIKRGLHEGNVSDSDVRNSLINTSGFDKSVKNAADMIKGSHKQYSTEIDRAMAQRDMENNVSQAKNALRQQGQQLGMTTEEIDSRLAQLDSIPNPYTDSAAIAKDQADLGLVNARTDKVEADIDLVGERIKTERTKQSSNLALRDQRKSAIKKAEDSDGNAQIDQILEIINGDSVEGVDWIDGSFANNGIPADALNGVKIDGALITNIFYKDGEPYIRTQKSGKSLDDDAEVDRPLNATTASKLFADVKTRTKFLRKLKEQQDAGDATGTGDEFSWE